MTERGIFESREKPGHLITRRSEPDLYQALCKAQKILQVNYLMPEKLRRDKDSYESLKKILAKYQKITECRPVVKEWLPLLEEAIEHYESAKNRVTPSDSY